MIRGGELIYMHNRKSGYFGAACDADWLVRAEPSAGCDEMVVGLIVNK